MSKTAVIILAAGKGTRMKSDIPKVCFQLAGKSLIQRVVDTSLSIKADLIAIVVGYKKEMVIDDLTPHPNIRFVTQEQQNGTGDAVRCARELFTGDGDRVTGDGNSPPVSTGEACNVFILCGDVPLLRPQTLSRMLEKHTQTKAKCTVLTMILDDPDRYGRIVRDENDKVCGIVEYRDASEQIRAIKEINTGIYCFDATALFSALEQIGNQNDQNEYYLTDTLKILYDEGKVVESVILEDINEAAGVNSQEQLAELEKVYLENIKRLLHK